MKPRHAPALLGLFCSLLAAHAGIAPDAAVLHRGEALYARCGACHAIEGHRTGPQHCGLWGRRAGTAAGFAGYTQALRDSRIVWDGRSLDRFLKNPEAMVPGTAMGYAGIPDAQERADLIAWLQHATRPGVACQPKP